MKFKLFAKQKVNTELKKDKVLKLGKKQIEKLVKQGITIQFVRS